MRNPYKEHLDREWELKMEGWLLSQKASIASIEAEIQGMMAENQYRISLGEGIVYRDKAFQEKADALLTISKDVLKEVLTGGSY